MTGKIYYRYFNWKANDWNIDGFYEYYDINNRKTRFTEKDFDKDPKYFVCSPSGGFARVINMKCIKKLIFEPCPWKNTYKDQYLQCYFNEKNYEHDINVEKINRISYDTVICGRDVFRFLEKFKNINEDLANETALIVELTKDEGRW